LEKNPGAPIFSGKVQHFLESFGALSIRWQLLNQVLAVIIVDDGSRLSKTFCGLFVSHSKECLSLDKICPEWQL